MTHIEGVDGIAAMDAYDDVAELLEHEPKGRPHAYDTVGAVHEGVLVSGRGVDDLIGCDPMRGPVGVGGLKDYG